MLDVVINPAGMREAYLEWLNRCFGDWGGQEMYRWCFERRVGDLPPDIMLLKKNGMVLAGSSVTYRTALVRGRAVNVAIMTGSWTLPQARNQGCFSRIIDESLGLADKKGAALLLAFVTHTNTSLKRLAGKGAALFPTHYLVSGENTASPRSDVGISVLPDAGRHLEGLHKMAELEREGMNHFTYTRSEWVDQFFYRPEKTLLVSIGGIGLAIIEQKGVFDRVIALIRHGLPHEKCLAALLAWAMANGRRLFIFTTVPSRYEEAVKLGFDHIPGFLTTTAANSRSLRLLYPEATGDKAIEETEFYDPNSPWHLGPWDLVHGDRM